MAKFQKGEIHSRGRPPGKLPSPIILWDIKHAARAHCEKSLQVIASCLDSADERIALAAAIAMLERGYGKPEQKADVTVAHKFCVAPQVMELDDWLANKGQPQLPKPNSDGGEKVN
jgi:hypothetical protein